MKMVQTFSYQLKPPDGTPHSNWVNATIFLHKYCKFSTKQETADYTAGIRVINAGNAFKTLSAPSSAVQRDLADVVAANHQFSPLELLG